MMKHVAYCPKCGTKIMEANNVGAFDDFTIKCWSCKKISHIEDVKFKQVAQELSTVDKNQNRVYNGV